MSVVKVYWRSHRKVDGDKVGRFIAWWTFGDYKHTSLAFEMDDGTIVGWESTFKHGVHSFVLDRIGGNNIDVKEIPLSRPQANEMLKAVKSVDGAGYDVKGIIGHVRRKIIQNPNKFYCTELAAWACNQVDFWVQELAPYSITPVVGHASTAMINRPDL